MSNEDRDYGDEFDSKSRLQTRGYYISVVVLFLLCFWWCPPAWLVCPLLLLIGPKLVGLPWKRPNP
jgi:hypothetical protein